MNVGMRWADYSNDPLAEKVEKAAAYYRRKYGQAPDLCFVHPSLAGEDPQPIGGVEVRAHSLMLPCDLWIGVKGNSSLQPALF